jgi:hypothetical protein
MYNKDIYHLLRRAFGQCIAIAQIVDFDVLDIVTIGDINFAIEVACALACGGRGGFGKWARGLGWVVRGGFAGRTGLLTERIGGTSACWMPFLAWSSALIFAAAAA